MRDFLVMSSHEQNAGCAVRDCQNVQFSIFVLNAHWVFHLLFIPFLILGELENH
jgi:hypothetical protein